METTVKFNNEEYILTSEAHRTNRRLPLYDYSDINDGELYIFEMVADAEHNGKKYRVYWLLKAIKGQEPELDQYDYSEVDSIEEV